MTLSTDGPTDQAESELQNLIRACEAGGAPSGDVRMLDVLYALPSVLRAFLPDSDWSLALDSAMVTAGDDAEGEFEVAKEDVAEALRAVRRLRVGLESAEVRLLRTARALGFSWGDIGKALGMSRQSAWERWAGVVDKDDPSLCLGLFEDGIAHVVRSGRAGRRAALCGKRGAAELVDLTDDSEVDCARCYESLGLVVEG